MPWRVGQKTDRRPKTEGRRTVSSRHRRMYFEIGGVLLRGYAEWLIRRRYAKIHTGGW
jgi:hypothetical protein